MRAAALFSLLPSLALAQVASGVTLLVDQGESALVTPADCSETLTVTWTAQPGGVACTDLALWSTAGECGEAPVGTDTVYASIPKATWGTTGTGSFSVVVGELPIFSAADGGLACGAVGQERKAKLCAAFTSTAVPACGSGETKVKVSAPPTVVYDSKGPAAPTLEAVTPRDGALSVQVVSSADTETVHLEVRRTEEGEFERKLSIAAETPTGRIGGLSNNVEYQVRAISEDAAGNLSAPSEVLTGMPIKTEGFFEDLRRSGSGEQGGCGASPGPGLGAIAGLVAAWLGTRKRDQKEGRR